MASKYKNFGITLLIFYIVIFLLFLYIGYLQSNGITPNALKILWRNETMAYSFFLLIFLTLVFGLVHGIYIYSKRSEKSYTKKDEKDILTTTFVGYFFIIIAHIILFTLFIFNTEFNELLISLYSLLTIIGIILISVGLSNIHEKDKKMNELKKVSIVAPVLITIITTIYGIAPSSNYLINSIFNTSLTNSSLTNSSLTNSNLNNSNLNKSNINSNNRNNSNLNNSNLNKSNLNTNNRNNSNLNTNNRNNLNTNNPNNSNLNKKLPIIENPITQTQTLNPNISSLKNIINSYK